MRRDEQQTLTNSISDLSASAALRDDLNESDIAMLIKFFKLLDSWDREKEHNAKVM